MCQKRLIFVKRGLRKRHTLCKRPPHHRALVKWSPNVKRDLQKRRVCVKRDLYLLKEAYIRETPFANVRHTTARTCHKKPVCVKRDLQKRPAHVKGDLFLSKVTYKKETYKIHVCQQTKTSVCHKCVSNIRTFMYKIYEYVSNIRVNNFFAYTSVSFGIYLCNTLV